MPLFEKESLRGKPAGTVLPGKLELQKGGLTVLSGSMTELALSRKVTITFEKDGSGLAKSMRGFEDGGCVSVWVCGV